jgi:hypothetical protein
MFTFATRSLKTSFGPSLGALATNKKLSKRWENARRAALARWSKFRWSRLLFPGHYQKLHISIAEWSAMQLRFLVSTSLRGAAVTEGA